MRKSNRMLAKMLLVLMQNRTRSRIYQIEFYSVKMIDQAFGLVCMGASARACVCVSAHIWVAVEIQTHEFGLLDHISVHINQVNAISICGEKRIKRQITLCSERQMQVYALPNRCWSVLGFILLLCYFCALSAFFSRLLQWNWIKYIHQYRCAISYLADTNTLQFSDRLSMLHLFHYIFDFILNANSFVYELFRIIRDL